MAECVRGTEACVVGVSRRRTARCWTGHSGEQALCASSDAAFWESPSSEGRHQAIWMRRDITIRRDGVGQKSCDVGRFGQSSEGEGFRCWLECVRGTEACVVGVSRRRTARCWTGHLARQALCASSDAAFWESPSSEGRHQVIWMRRDITIRRDGVGQKSCDVGRFGQSSESE